MNWSHIWELMKINILYSNSQGLAAIRKRQAKYPQKKIVAYKSMLRSQIALILFYSIIFLYLFMTVNYKYYPGYFSLQLMVFSLMATVSAFSTMFSVFYNSRDSKLYLPLPVTEREIFLAKLLSSIGMNLTFLIPTLPLLVIAYGQILGNVIIAVPLALLQFLILAALSISASIFLVHFLGKVLMKTRHRDLISFLLMTISTLGAVGLILFIQRNPIANVNLADKGQALVPDMPKMPLFIGFYEVTQGIFSLKSLSSYWLLLAILVLLLALMFKLVIPNYYKQLVHIDERQAVTRKTSRQFGSLRTSLIRHHLSTLKDPTLIMIAFTTSLMFVIFVIPLLLNNGLIHKIPNDYFGLALLVGLFLGYLTSSAFTMVGISLERGNYHFIRGLPFNIKAFLKQKFWTLWAVQTLIPFSIYLIIGLLLKVQPLVLLGLVAGLLLASYPAALSTYKHDYKHLSLNWQNINELLNRGSRQLLNMILFFVSIILTALVSLAAYLLSGIVGPWTVSFLILILALLGVVGLHIYFTKTLWDKLK